MDVLQKGWGWLLGLGILLVVLGVLLIAAPVAGTVAVDVLVAWFLIIGGVAQVVHAFMEKAWRGFVLELASGVLFLVVGGLLLFRPLTGVQALTLFLAAFLLVEGIVRIAMAMRLRPAQGWVWLLVDGILAVILALLIWAQWPSSALWVIGLLVGINLLFTGWSLIMIAIAVRGQQGREARSTP